MDTEKHIGFYGDIPQDIFSFLNFLSPFLYPVQCFVAKIVTLISRYRFSIIACKNSRFECFLFSFSSVIPAVR